MTKVFSVKENSTGGESSPQMVVIDLSSRLKFFIVLGVCIVFFRKQIFSIALFLMLSFVLMSVCLPIVSKLRKKGVSKHLAIFIAYAGLILVLISIFSVVIVPLVTQLGDFVGAIPEWIGKVTQSIENVTIAGNTIDMSAFEKSLMDSVNSLTTIDSMKSITSFFSSFFSSIGTLITAMMFSIYLMLEHDSLLDLLLLRITSDEKKERVRKLIADVEGKLGNWILGQGLVSLLSMIYSSIVLSILKIPFAIPFAVFIALMGMIPNIGSTLATVIVSLITLLIVGPVKAAFVLAFLALYQPVENTLIYPRIMGNVIGLKPLVVMLGVVASIIVFGPIGGLLALPGIVILKILYEFYIDLQKIKAKGIV
ncbi:MAG TPA: AI-2E family transporter [Candidatus Dojkabacteria bacterium]|nr:AI-2E family transporter [Candidatus Dojkabacteria bacterium]